MGDMPHAPSVPISTPFTMVATEEKVLPSLPRISIPDKIASNAGENNSIVSLFVDDDEYPDGGLRAWLVVLGAVCCNFATFGFVNTWGVFQSYYENTLLKDWSASQIAWIGSVQYALVFLPSQVVGRMFDLGYLKFPFFLGTVALIVATFLVASCRQYWHFLLCQGFAIGIAAGVCFGPTVGVIGHWFKRRRGIALGITSTGSAMGGTVLPIAARHLIKIIGFPWTMRIIGFILTFTLGISNLTLKRRLPPKDVPGGMFNVHAFKNPAFVIYCCVNTVAYLGVYTVLTFIDISAVNIGISPEFSFYLVSFVNASSGIGRLFTGLMVDIYGAVNVMIPMTLGAAMMTLAWPYAHGKGSMIAIAITYGFTASAYVTAFPIPVYNMGMIEDVGRRIGTVMVCAAMGAVAGPPISGAINAATGSTKLVSYYAGGTILLSIMLMLATRHLMLRKLRGKF